MAIRVFVLDDHELVRRGLRDLISVEADMTLAGEATTAEEALARIPATSPHVALLDVRLPDSDGIEVCREIRSRHPEVACLVLTSYSDDEAVYAAIMAGAAGYLLKKVRGDHLLAAIRQVSAGGSLLDPTVTARLMERIRHGGDEELGRLSKQERTVLGLVAEGLTNRQIGERLYLAEKTIKNHVSSLLGKLGMSRRSEAAAFAARLAERHRRTE